MTDYLEQALRCRTENELNRLHIQLELVSSPHELADIARSSDAPTFPASSHAWLGKLRGWAPGVFERPERFTRRLVNEHVQLFEGQNGAGRRKLLIGFSGRSRRMMIPNPIFLQAFDSERWDVAIVMHSGGSYFDGLPGVAASIPELAGYLRRELDFARYRDVSVLGVSAGGPPAIVAALAIGARRGVSISGVFRADRAAETAGPSGILDGLVRRRRITFAFGAGYEPDRISANAMANAWGGRVLPVPGVTKHNVMSWLMRRQRLEEFMRKTF